MIPNQFPSLRHSECRLAIIADAPGKEETYTNKPFTGSSARLLSSLLSKHNLTLNHCFLGYVSPTQPPDDDFDRLDFQGPEITQGITNLRSDLSNYKPNCTLALGSGAFRALAPGGFDDFSEDHRWGVGKIRGSILLHGDAGILPQGNNKFIPTYDPSYVFRAYYELPFLKNDIARAVSQSRFAEHRPTVRRISIRPTFEEACDLLRSVRASRVPTGFDVEGWNDNVGVTMYSIATSPFESTVIPIWLGGRHYWSVEQEETIWLLTSQWLEDPACPKIVTNAMYELFIMAWKHRIIVSNITEDTMFKQWAIHPELPKSLATQISLWTLEPYYKDDRTSTDEDTKLIYSGKDPALSYECSLAQDTILRANPPAYAHYRFNCDLIPAIGYMQLRGCRFDKNVAANHSRATSDELLNIQPKLDAALLEPALAAGVLTRKRKSDPYHFNVKSVPQKKWLLYQHLGYKPSARTGQSTNEVTILKYYMKDKNPILKLLLDGVSIRTRLSDIDKLTTDADGRIRSNFNLVGTDTARLSSRESNAMEATFTKTGILHWENTGTNLQNVTKELRDCFIPDTSEHAFFECDLSGADGWTVAADLAAVGHTTMLDDYLAGIKPVKVLLLMLDEHERGGNPARINHLDRSTLRDLCKAIKFPEGRDELNRPGDWKYLCMKRVQHGSNYDMQPELLATTIFKDSEGTIDLTVKQATLYQYLYKLRYNVDARKQDIIRRLSVNGTLTTAGGTTRKFFDLRNKREPEPAVVRSALSFEPQFNTTYATNLALKNLWYDPENRTSLHTLHIEPLLLIHDAIAGQFKRKHADWAVNKIKTYFQNDLIVHGIKIRIPFEGKYGSSWRNCKEFEFAG